MKRLISISLAIIFSTSLFAQLKPYIQAIQTDASVASTVTRIQEAAEGNGLNVVGSYTPATSIERQVVVVSSAELIGAVKKVGGLTGFAAVLRIGITREGNITNVSYTNPKYWGNAYFRDDFEKVSVEYQTVQLKLQNTMKAIGDYKPVPFGSEKGEDVKSLREYQYMFGMPEFDDTVELRTYSSFSEAKKSIDMALKTPPPGLKQVYRIEIPGEELVLYGIGISGEDGETHFMPIIDIDTPKHTAFLPYEMLVIGDEVHMLHGRYRIALSFPDLTMGTFSKIMSTPGDIEEALEQLTN
ncbi:MAG: hypothetical protein HQ500_04970 [Flavobacteriales bacterium]|nr:hypothetical protein [Flavobacteriales bacterium]